MQHGLGRRRASDRPGSGRSPGWGRSTPAASTVVPFGNGVPTGGYGPDHLARGHGVVRHVDLGGLEAGLTEQRQRRRRDRGVVTSGTGTRGSRATTTDTVGDPPWGSLATAPPAAGSVRSTVPGGWSLSSSVKLAVRFCAARVWVACGLRLADHVGHDDGGAARRQRDEPALGDLAAALGVLAEDEIGRLVGLVDVLAGDREPWALRTASACPYGTPATAGTSSVGVGGAAVAEVGVGEEEHDERDQQRERDADHDRRTPPAALPASGRRRGGTGAARCRGRGCGDAHRAPAPRRAPHRRAVDRVRSACRSARRSCADW